MAGLDPAFSSDPFGVVLVGRARHDSRRLVVGAVRAWAPRRRAVSLEEGRDIEDTVLAEVATVLRTYDARAVTDQYRAAGVAERLRRYGLTVRSEPMTAPTKDAAFGFLRGRVNEGGIELPDDRELIRELRAIRTRYAAGRSSVVLPRIGGSHCDRAQALALAVYEHDRLSLDAGATMSIPTGAIARSPRFLDGVVYPDADAVGPFARERLALMRARAGVPGSTRWHPDVRQ